MPFTITPQCSGNDTICESICPYDCIKAAESIAADSRSRLQIDAPFCVDCGLCAIACPEQAIVYAGAYYPMSLNALGQASWMRPRPRRLSVATIAEAAVSLSASGTSVETNR
jgi:NAD-dependent dihydropyrimidine dehydrogenase PreA subunit